MDLKTARSLTVFVNEGGKIVFIGKKPFKSADFINGHTNDAAVKRIVDDLTERDNVVVYPAPTGDVIRWYGELQDKMELNPYVRFDKTHKYLSQSNYRIGKTNLFFIANTSLSEHISVTAEFQITGNLRPWIWDPETGEKMLYPTNGSNNKIQLELPRATSVMIVFESESEGKWFNIQSFKAEGKVLNGSWTIKLKHINGEEFQLELNELSDLIDIGKTKEFAGEVIYEKTINIDSDKYRYIDLGNVQGVSELTLNGQLTGTKWYGAHVYDGGSVLKKGENIVSVKLTTIVGNYLKSCVDNPVAMQWTQRQDYYSMGILGPVTLKEA